MSAQDRKLSGSIATKGEADPKGRVSAPLKAAIRLRLYEGLTIDDACEQAGISVSGWHAAMKRQAVASYFQEQEDQYIKAIERLKGRHKARALEIAAQLMEGAKSEAVRMRAVEFFAGEKASGNNIAVQVNVDRGGYDYVRPGVQVVEIKDNDAWQAPGSDPSSQGNRDKE